ncbi:hypothetical protein ACFE04_024751 [Oxalis oulophora]
MATSSSSFLILYICLVVLASSRFVYSSTLSNNNNNNMFIYDVINYQSPLSISPIPPLEVTGDYLDRVLATKQRNASISLLFYASSCPFSRNLRPIFHALSFMFPEIQHFAIEQSSAMPSVFSRYGIHTLPSILMVNQTSKFLYQGSKELHSLVRSYEKITGLEAVHYSAGYVSKILESGEKSMERKWNGPSSLKETMKRELYLAFAILFLCLRVILYIFPKVVSHLKAVWVSCAPNLNLEIFGETSQLFGHALNVIDGRRIWTRFRLCKTRNFREGARNAGVWASSRLFG